MIRNFLRDIRIDLEDAIHANDHWIDIEHIRTLKHAVRLASTLVGYVEEVVNERLDLVEIEQISAIHPYTLEDVLKAYRTIDRILDTILSCYLPVTEHGRIHFFTTTIGHDISIVPYRGHMYGRYISVFMAPSIDLLRTTFWSCFAHEAAHIRLGQVEYIPPAMGAEEFARFTMQYVSDLSKVVLRTEYKYLDFLSQRRLLSQFDETLCDLMSVLFVGPASPLALASLADPMAETRTAETHPPLVSRIDYMLKALEVICHQDDEPCDLVNRIRNQWASYSSGIMNSPSEPRRSKHYVKDYTEFVDLHLRGLLEIASQFVSGQNVMMFDYGKWTSANNFIESDFDVTTGGLDIIALLNVPWALDLMDSSAQAAVLSSHQDDPWLTKPIVNAVEYLYG